jgi:hypothetical protein
MTKVLTQSWIIAIILCQIEGIYIVNRILNQTLENVCPKVPKPQTGPEIGSKQNYLKNILNWPEKNNNQQTHKTFFFFNKC